MKNSDIVQIQLPADAFRVLVVSDLHGRPQLLERLLKRADYRPGEDYLLILGDLIEKGPDSPGALKLAYRLAQNDRVYAIRGNVDRWCGRLFFGSAADALSYTAFRPHNVLTQYAAQIGIKTVNSDNLEAIRSRFASDYEKEAAWLAGLPLALETDRYLFVHSGVTPGDWRQSEDRDVTANYRFWADGKNETGKWLVLGHIPTRFADDGAVCFDPAIDEKRHVINVDGGTILPFGQLNLFVITRREGRDAFSFLSEPVHMRYNMKKPLYEAISGYADARPVRMHMPGHKGVCGDIPFMGEATKYDVTELAETGDLYGSALFEASENEAAKTAEVPAVCYSAGGSTLCIQAMMKAFFAPKSRVLLRRGSHRSILNTVAILDLEPVWLPEPERFTPIAPETVLSRLDDCDGVLLTSPDYFGVDLDLEALAVACRQRGIPFLVDGAHSAHFPLIGRDYAIAKGADAVCISLHKTLGALTGGAAVLLADPAKKPLIKADMACFGSSSPSYLISLSVESAFAELCGDCAPAARCNKVCYELRGQFRDLIADVSDPWRIGLNIAAYDEKAVCAALRRHTIVPEWADCATCLLLVSAHNTPDDLAALRALCGELAGLPRTAVKTPPTPPPIPPQILSSRESFDAPSETISVHDVVGRVCARPICPCPPCHAVITYGEQFTPQIAQFLKKTGILTADVVK